MIPSEKKEDFANSPSPRSANVRLGTLKFSPSPKFLTQMKDKLPINKVITAVADCLDAKSFQYELKKDKQLIRLGLDAKNGRWSCIAYADDSNRFIFQSMIPVNAPEERRLACAELFTRINQNLSLGHFAIDLSDGELSFRTTVPSPKRGRLTRDVVDHIVGGHHILVDRFIPAITRVLFSMTDPTEALSEVPPKPSAPEISARFRLN